MLSSLCFIVVLAAAEPPKPAAVPPAASAASAAPAAPAVVAPAPRPVPKPAAKPATKPAAKPAETPAAAAAPQAAAVDPRASAEKEFEFLSDAAARAQSTKEYRASASALDVFADAHPRADFAASALSELAAAQERLKDSTALVTWLRLIYEFPDSPQAKSGRESFLSFASDRLSRRLRPAAADIAQPAPGAGAADRLAALLERLSGPLSEELYGPALDLAARFERRFPSYEGDDRVGLAAARLWESEEDWQSALLAYRRMLALYPASTLRADALWGEGNLLADKLRDYRAAVPVFMELADKHQADARASLALERAGDLLAKKLDEYEPAVGAYDKLVQRYPGTQAARRALREAAKLERGKLGNPEAAAKSLETLADQFPGQPEAPEALYEAAQIYEDDLKDAARAIAEYKKLAEKFPDQRLGRKAASRAAKLQSE